MPRLHSLAKTGKIVILDLRVEEMPDKTCKIITTHGQLNGKLQEDISVITTGKNIGKKNETTIAEQAVLDMVSKWNKKKDSNYTENENGIPNQDEKSLLPMLAHKFKDKKHKVKFPCLLQPKLNGLRCVSRNVNGTVQFTSRKYKPYTALSFMSEGVQMLLDYLKTTDIRNYIADGEVYTHGISLQDINSMGKKEQDITDKLEYHIYDIADDTTTNEYRSKVLKDADLNVDFPSYIKIVPTHIVHNENEIQEYLTLYESKGYEGVMIRNMKGLYLFEKRSDDLLKLKTFDSDEFEVVGVTASDTGREKDAIIYICKVKNPTVTETFEVRPKGTIEDRINDYLSGNHHIGEFLTVNYKGLSNDNVPQIPTGECFRREEDLP